MIRYCALTKRECFALVKGNQHLIILKFVQVQTILGEPFNSYSKEKKKNGHYKTLNNFRRESSSSKQVSLMLTAQRPEAETKGGTSTGC